MRTVWNTLSFLAVVNLFALVIVIAWLWQSGRLTRERAQDIRAMFATTVGQASDEANRLATEAEAARLLEETEEMKAHPPGDSAMQISQISLVHQQTVEARRRLEDERRMLAQQLEHATQQMESRAEELKREQSDSRNSRASDAQKRGGEQFLRAVKQLEQVPAKQAKKILETLVAGKNVDQAVAYLDAMNPRAAAKVLREFKTDTEIPLATELLERLRTRGVTEAMTPSPPASGASNKAAPSPLDESSNAALPAGDNPKPGNNADAR